MTKKSPKAVSRQRQTGRSGRNAAGEGFPAVPVEQTTKAIHDRYSLDFDLSKAENGKNYSLAFDYDGIESGSFPDSEKFVDPDFDPAEYLEQPGGTITDEAPTDEEAALSAALENWLRAKNVDSTLAAAALAQQMELIERVKDGSITRSKPTELPGKAPKLYVDRQAGHDIIKFLQDPNGWGPYVAAGLLSRADLLHFDRTAYFVLAKWLGEHGNEFPPEVGFDLPKKRAVTDRQAAVTPPEKRSARLDWALRSRDYRAKHSP